ncbi:hypothetical protein D1AOALGA4SA_13162 [Olavius algarvensis Delta 1 endosymbiont]|nr:hypothetical protein D1AOALGA4SA_13162 [Olavius algarvensis Delta 1 endosymbiont]
MLDPAVGDKLKNIQRVRAQIQMIRQRTSKGLFVKNLKCKWINHPIKLYCHSS